jgi:glycosyltransferase involved in cell wall biosynthesis
MIYLRMWKTRIRDWRRMNRYDIIFICREALVTGSIFFEKKFSHSRAKLVYDFDDAIWMEGVGMSEGNKRLAFLKKPAKTGEIIALCDLTFAGNQFLANYARQFTNNVEIVPSTIDMNVYGRREKKINNGKVCIGWTGSPTTLRHFEVLIPALKKIKDKFGERVEFKIIGDEKYFCAELNVRGIRWVAETETDDLSQIDIGIMPLPDEKWEKGKCGMKGLQYMGLGIPTVMSPVGTNLEIIQNGINGYLPGSEEEWVETLSQLIESSELRERIGRAGRQTVIEKYSVESWKQKYLDSFNTLTAAK